MSSASKRCKDRPFVLFADDDPSILEMLKVAAEIRGWCVDTATTAREILQKVNEHCGEMGTCYDAVVADVHYFDTKDTGQYRMTGISAAQQIRQKYKDLPIIFMSAYGSVLMKDEALTVGDAFFDKPFEKKGQSVEDLLDRVQQLIEFTSFALGGPGHRTAHKDPLRVPQVIEDVAEGVRAEKARRAS